MQSKKKKKKRKRWISWREKDREEVLEKERARKGGGQTRDGERSLATTDYY